MDEPKNLDLESVTMSDFALIRVLGKGGKSE